MANLEHLRLALESARSCVHKGQALQALEYLHGIRLEVDELVGSLLWAEYAVIYAGALAGMNDATAEFAFRDALERCSKLSQAQADRQVTMRAHADYAAYLAGRRQLGRAKDHYREAEKIAESLGHEEDVAHFQNCATRLELEEKRSPHLIAFQRLQEASKDGFTEVQQREAWFQYTERFQELAYQGQHRRHGGQASADYFRGLLCVIKRSGK